MRKRKLIYSIQTSSLSDLPHVAVETKKILPTGSMIFLEGELGAGKTTFVSCFCDLFSIQLVQSPTYSIHQRYSNSIVVIDHFDLYRLETAEQIESAGIFDLLEQKSDYAFIEWSDRIPEDQYPENKEKFYLKLSNYRYELFY